MKTICDYAIYMLDRQGRMTSWNAGAQRFKGYSADEIIGEHFSRFYTPEEKAAGVPATALETPPAPVFSRLKVGEFARTARVSGRTSSSILLGIRTGNWSVMPRSRGTLQIERQRTPSDAVKNNSNCSVQGVTDYAIYMLDPRVE